MKSRDKEKEPASVETTSSSNNNSMPNDTTSTSEKQDRLKGRHFWYVVYPESAPEDWVEQLKQTGLTFCVSPLHDKDINPDGTPKKPHYHVIVSWSNTTTYRSARALAETMLNCPRPQLLKNPTGAYRYHQHKDNPEKYQYQEQSKSYNGWVRPLDSNEVTAIKAEIHKMIYLEDIQEYGELITVCGMRGPEYVDVAMGNTYYCERLCSSYRNNPIRGLMRFYDSLEDGDEAQQLIKARIEYILGEEGEDSDDSKSQSEH